MRALRRALPPLLLLAACVPAPVAPEIARAEQAVSRAAAAPGAGAFVDVVRFDAEKIVCGKVKAGPEPRFFLYDEASGAVTLKTVGDRVADPRCLQAAKRVDGQSQPVAAAAPSGAAG